LDVLPIPFKLVDYFYLESIEFLINFSIGNSIKEEEEE